ncbi:acyltransferase [Tepidibacter hydrothermalis]|uniref:Acyltransferase n=1 Tax=Tepidibacter hydrothermalis TaxID=3036126 RepID=A0ABY8EEW8_9FIRM|nr:acyltransferase [Tepidibacter hydrothermalis]WFD10032.1 acyltransferase [Tepidibacter hydrothermalis]
MNEEMKVYFLNFGQNNNISEKASFSKAKRIYIGDGNEIWDGVRISVNREVFNTKVDWNIKIHSDVFININTIIQAYNQIEIENFVLIGPNVYISDNSHEYSLIDVPISLQGFMKKNNKVTIKEGAWIGAGARVIGDITIGYGAVVAANGVVVKDVPSHSVVGGVPAKIIKIYDYRIDHWINVKDNYDLLQEILTNRGIFNGYDYEKIEEVKKKNIEEKYKRKWEMPETSKNQDDISVKTVEKSLNFIEEQFNYIKENISLKDCEEIINILVKVLDNILIVGNSLDSIKKECIENKIEYVTNNLNTFFDNILKYYRENDIEKLKESVVSDIIPAYIQWKKEITRCLNNYEKLKN